MDLSQPSIENRRKSKVGQKSSDPLLDSLSRPFAFDLAAFLMNVPTPRGVSSAWASVLPSASSRFAVTRDTLAG